MVPGVLWTGDMRPLKKQLESFVMLSLEDWVTIHGFMALGERRRLVQLLATRI